MDAFFETVNEVYDTYGRPSVNMQDDDPCYSYRHDFHHAEWAGEPWTDVNGGVPEHWRVEDEDLVEDNPYGRIGVSCGIVPDAELMFVPGEDDGEGIPDGWQQAEYPGICPGRLLYRRVALPGGGVITGTAYMAEALDGVKPMVAEWLESYPEAEISFRCRVFYSGSNQVPEGVLLQARDDMGSFLLCRYFWNVQPGIGIDYADGRSWVEAAGDPEASIDQPDGAPDEKAEEKK